MFLVNVNESSDKVKIYKCVDFSDRIKKFLDGGDNVF
jgi:hypothetical protein